MEWLARRRALRLVRRAKWCCPVLHGTLASTPSGVPVLATVHLDTGLTVDLHPTTIHYASFAKMRAENRPHAKGLYLNTRVPLPCWRVPEFFREHVIASLREGRRVGGVVRVHETRGLRFEVL